LWLEFFSSNTILPKNRSPFYVFKRVLLSKFRLNLRYFHCTLFSVSSQPRHLSTTVRRKIRHRTDAVFRFPFSVFRFPFSVFRFPFSFFRFPFSVFLFPLSLWGRSSARKSLPSRSRQPPLIAAASS